MRIILFDGQGTCPSLNPSYLPTSSPSSTSEPPASTLLAALFSRQIRTAVSSRLAHLPPSTCDALHVSSAGSIFSRLRSGGLALPTADPELLRYPLVALPSLYIAQVLRLLEDLEMDRITYDAHDHVIGFSSGLLPALLVATSFPSPSRSHSAATQVAILRNALALLDVAVLLGVESQITRDAMFAAGGIALDDPARQQEWSAVILGETRETLEEELEVWNSRIKDTVQRIHLTAQTSDTSHTVSGLPSSLREFLSHRGTNSTTFSASLTHGTTFNPSFDTSLLERAAGAALEPKLNRSSSPRLSFSSYRISGSLERPPVIEPVEPCAPIPVAPATRNFYNPGEPSTTRHQPTPASSVASSRRQSAASSAKPIGIYALFHTDITNLRVVRENVLASLFCSTSLLRGELPNGTCDVLEGLHLGPDVVLYDTRSGSAVSSSLTGRLLIERVLDLILLERVEFLKVLERIAEVAKSRHDIEILNYGPGSGLARTTMRSLKERTLKINITINDVSTSQCPNLSQRSSGKNSSPEPIAIVGMAVNFPGAHDANELWSLLEMGLNAVEEIPQSRFSIEPFVAEANPNRQMKTRIGCFLPENLHSSFDNAFFRISPREARALDPQMRVLMRVGLQAVESAGLVVEDFSGDETPKDLIEAGVIRSEDVGCFVGVATNDYLLNLRNDIGVHYATGTLPAFLAGRLAYALHLSGPSVVLNTACSSSLVAVHQACRALLAGDCKAALAGGVNVVTSPDMYAGLDRAHFLSSTGNCRPWDASADGYCRAEGCGMFVLKRLSDAISSSDNILGVIRGTEVNQSASAVSITRPHGGTQAALFRSLLNQANVRPEEVSLVEAHGTGTQAGDPEELNSLRDVLSPSYGRDRTQSNMLTVTSIKANIGHSEAASGAASLAKVLLMFRHKAVPTQIGLKNLNPKIQPLDRDFTRINTTGSCVDWHPGLTGRRIALVNNFGAAGSNAAMLVEEAPEMPSPPSACAKESSDQVVVALSAETESALVRLRNAYVSSMEESSLLDFAYTATSRRKLRPWRMAVAAESATGAIEALLSASPVRVAQSSDEDPKKIIFVFSGQGGQHLRMGQQLYKISATFRAHVIASHERLLSWGYPGVLAIIDAKGPVVSGLQKVDELVAFQCAIFVLECALCELWGSWGVSPDAVIGHSLGEYAALVSAGVVSQDTGLRLVARRARLMTLMCKQSTSGMLVVRQSPQFVLDMFSAYKDCNKLSIACFNGPAEVVVGGPNAQLRRFETLLGTSGAKFARVNVPYAYHTSVMNPVLDELSDFARKFDYKAPRIPIASNAVGAVVQPGDASVFGSSYFAKHCRQPVLFEKGIRNLVDCVENIGSFIEIGPHPTTLPMFSSLASDLGAASLPSLNRKTTARSSLSTALSRMFLFRTSVVWGKAYRELYPGARCMEIPTYPLNETDYWTPYVEEAACASLPTQSLDPLRRFPFLASWSQKPSSQDGNISEFETPIDRLAEYITGHKVASHSLCPASVYFELALSAATCTLEFMENGLTDALCISDTQFSHPLVYDETTPLVIRTSINVHPRGGKHAGTFSISSNANGKELHVHCTGFFQRREPSTLLSKLQLHSGNIQRRKASLLSAQNDLSTETLRSRTLYDLIFPRVVQYSKLYQTITAMTLDDNSGEGLALVRLSEEQTSKPSATQPVFVDTLLHAAGFLINSRASSGDAYICGQVDSMKMLSDIDCSTTYEVYCATTPANDGMVVADAWAVEAKEPRKVVAYLKRMRFSRVRLSSLSKVFSRSIESYEAPASPTLSVSHFEQCATPLMPPKLGSPFRTSQRPHSSSSASSITAVNGTFDMTYSVMKLVAEMCGVPVDDVKMSSEIADLGVDSLIWIEIASQLKSIVHGACFDVSELMISKTVGDLISKVSKCNPQFIPTFSVEPRAPVAKLAIPALRIPDSPVAEKTSDSDTTLLYRVKEVLGEVLDIPVAQLSEDETLDSLGLDSLGSIEALQNLQEKFRVSLPHGFFRDYRTVDEVHKYILNALSARSPSRQSNSSAVSNTEAVVKILGHDRCLSSFQSCKSDTGSSPLFLIHDGSGLSHCYARLGNLGRSLWGISNPKLLSGEYWSGGIPEMASHYIDQIRPMATRNGCVLGGWSFGGVVAFHMAVELINAGVQVAGVVLIDSPSPFTEQPLSEDLINSVIQAGSHTASASDKQAKVIELARIQMGHATRALVNYNPLNATSRNKVLPNVVMLRCRDAFPMSNLPAFVPSMKRIPFLEDRSDPRSIVKDWESLIGRDVPVLDIPGHHFEPFSAKNVSSLTSQLIKAIDLLESNAY